MKLTPQHKQCLSRLLNEFNTKAQAYERVINPCALGQLDPEDIHALSKQNERLSAKTQAYREKAESLQAALESIDSAERKAAEERRTQLLDSVAARLASVRGKSVHIALVDGSGSMEPHLAAIGQQLRAAAVRVHAAGTFTDFAPAAAESGILCDAVQRAGKSARFTVISDGDAFDLKKAELTWAAVLMAYPQTKVDFVVINQNDAEMSNFAKRLGRNYPGQVTQVRVEKPEQLAQLLGTSKSRAKKQPKP